MLKKWICLLLCISTLALPLLACGADPAETSSASGDSNADQTASGDESDVYVADVPVIDMEGRVFRVLCRDYGYGSTSITGFNGEVIQRPDYDEATAGVVDQAKAEVRRRVEERYNCLIEGDFGQGDVTQFNDIIRNDVLSGSGMYDMVMPIVRVDKTGEEPAMVMDGTAVFRRGEYAGELDEAATRGLLFGRGDLQTCTYPLSLPGTAEEPERLTVEVVSSKTKVRIRPEGEAAVIRLTISCKATVLEEYRAAGLESSDLKAVAGALQEAILQDVRSALDKTIGDWGCDVYGFSRMVKKKAPELVRGREDEWPARLRDCRFEVEVKADAAKAGGVAGGGIMQK